MTLRFGSLFSGIGGLDLGLERAGMEVVWQSEVDPYCSQVLAKHWPHVPNLGDVTKVDWEHVERVDLICGGYPCQPFSLAGARRGHDDPRHLWPHFANALRVLRPRYALLENVPGHLSLGFGDVLGDLADLGYDAEWDCIPAAAVGAPHLRYRVFVVAHHDGTSSNGRSRGEAGRDEVHENVGVHARRSCDGTCAVPDTDRDGVREQQVGIGRRGGSSVAVVDGTHGNVADTDSETRRATWSAGQTVFRPGSLQRFGRCSSGGWGDWPVEPDVGRVAYGVPSRVDRLRGLGNAVVPQVAEWIGRQLLVVCDRAGVSIPKEES